MAETTTETKQAPSRKSPTALLEQVLANQGVMFQFLQRIAQNAGDTNAVIFRANADLVETMKAEVAEQQAEAEEAARLTALEATDGEEE